VILQVLFFFLKRIPFEQFWHFLFSFSLQKKGRLLWAISCQKSPQTRPGKNDERRFTARLNTTLPIQTNGLAQVAEMLAIFFRLVGFSACSSSRNVGRILPGRVFRLQLSSKKPPSIEGEKSGGRRRKTAKNARILFSREDNTRLQGG